jgi:anti-anti-sigma regulatory factor
MEYRISKLKESILIKVLGPFNKNAVHSVSTFLEPFLSGNSTRITLDIDNLKDEREIVFHLGLVNAFKKAIDQVGGKLTVRAESSCIRSYLNKTGMDRIFFLINP